MPKAAGRRRKKAPASAPRRIVVHFSEALYAATEGAAAEQGTNRSTLVRSAVEHYLELLRRRRLEQEMAEGYEANAEMDRLVAQGFAAIDAEGW
jgi:metal-responsive CopG/Arc/MetJ family transcriptional regulator